MISEVEITSTEKIENKKNFYQALVVVIIIFLVLSPIAYCLSKEGPLFVKLFIGGVLLYLIYILTKMMYGAYIDMTSGYKYKVYGKITNKRIEVKSFNSTSTGGGFYGGGKYYSSSSSGSGKTTCLFWVEVDGFSFKVEEIYYDKIKIGDTIDVCVSKGSLFMTD